MNREEAIKEAARVLRNITIGDHDELADILDPPPKPRECWVNFTDVEIDWRAYNTERVALLNVADSDTGKSVHMREVTE